MDDLPQLLQAIEKLKQTELELAYHLSTDSVKRMKELEKEGYVIQLPE